MIPRKYSLAFILSVLVVLTAATASAQTTHYTLNGDFGRVYWSQNEMFGDLYVSRSHSGKTLTTFMSFDLWYSQLHVISGTGSIPNSAFTGDWGAGLRLNLDTQNFVGQAYDCYYDNVFSTPQCYELKLTGTIDASWQKTNQTSESYTTVYRSRLPGRRVMERGSEENVSATARVNILGIDVENVYAVMGKTHNVNMDIYIGPN